MLRPDITWEDRHGKRGMVSVDSIGLRVSTGGTPSPDLTDTAELIRLRNAINQILISRGKRS